MPSSTSLLKRAGFTIVFTCVAALGLSCAPSELQTGDAIFSSPTAVAFDRASSQATLTTPASVEPRSSVITYVVEPGENLFSIADKFGLHPETILWANETPLHGNPRGVRPGVELYILPVDGVQYKWQRGDDLTKIAERFSVEPEAILNWPGNQLDPQDLNIVPGTALIIPGGHPPLMDPSEVTIHMSSDPTPQP